MALRHVALRDEGFNRAHLDEVGAGRQVDAHDHLGITSDHPIAHVNARALPSSAMICAVHHDRLEGEPIEHA